MRSDFDLNLVNIDLYNQADCFICVQTLNFVYNVENAISEIYRILSPGGTALVTVANLSPISIYDLDRWGDYWRMTSLGIKKLFNETFGETNVELQIFGNYSATVMFLAGYSLEEVDLETLAKRDKDFEMIIGIRANKK
jgi:SAM-dependent methyltransferase